MKYLASILHVVTVAGLTALVLYVMRKISARRRPAELGLQSGRIAPGKISAGLIMAVALILLAGAGVALVEGEIKLCAIMAVIALPVALYMAPSLTHRHDVRWDGDGVSGPDRQFGLTLGWTTTHIAWRDIADTGRTVTGYDYLESRFGTRIYWSYLYPGHGFLEQAITTYRATPPGGRSG